MIGLEALRQSGDDRGGEPDVGTEELGERRGEVLGRQPVQIEQRQHLGHLRRSAAPRRQDRALEAEPLSAVGIDASVVHPGNGHFEAPGDRRHRSWFTVAVANDEAMTGLVELV